MRGCSPLFGMRVISHKDVEEVTEKDWDRIFAVNLKAAFFLAQQAFPHLELTRGNIINVSSTNAIRPASRNQLYDSLKAALNNLTQGLALDFRDSGCLLYTSDAADE